MNLSHFPNKFYWGNSTSSMQTEGAWNIDGKGPSVYDVRKAGNNSTDWHVAIDEYHRYEEDLDLMQEMGMNMYRIQISWSRVNPTGNGEFNDKGIAFYDRLINAMLKRGIEPMICLYHFDMPLNLAQKKNGFMSRETVDAFVRFAKRMVDHFSDKVKYWITFNEHNLYFTNEVFNISGYESGNRSIDEMYQIFHHTILAHARVANYIHENYPDLKIGGMTAYTPVYPATSDPLDNLMANQVNEFLYNNLNDVFVNGEYSPQVMQWVKNHEIKMDIQKDDLAIIKQTKSDFLAFSYYQSTTLNSHKVTNDALPNTYLESGGEINPYTQQTKWGWNIDALGFRNIITNLYNRYHIPVFPIENGIGLEEKWDGVHEIDDQVRIDYHHNHIKAMRDAINEDGAVVLGYLGWGLIDIPSSQGNMEKRYGAVYVNRSNHDLKDLKRIPKKSFYWFKKVFESNGDDLDE